MNYEPETGDAFVTDGPNGEEIVEVTGLGETDGVFSSVVAELTGPDGTVEEITPKQIRVRLALGIYTPARN